MMDSTTAPIIAPQNPDIVSGVRVATRAIERALTTNKNSPKVRMVKGNVRRIMMGLTRTLTRPKTRAVIIIGINPDGEKDKPTFNCAVSQRAAALISQRAKILIGLA